MQLPIVVWDAREWRANPAFNSTRVNCMVCPNPDSKTRHPQYDCQSLAKGFGAGDLLLIIGTGTVSCAHEPASEVSPQCTDHPLAKHTFYSLDSLDTITDTSKAVTVHFPVRALHALSSEVNIFGYKHVIPDDSFFKPLGGSSETIGWMGQCHKNNKTKDDLLYVARFIDHKGQLKFVQQADAELLKGYTIHMYGAGGLEDATGRRYVLDIQSTALNRGISVSINHQVPKQELLHHMCTAAGQILWPEKDSNPRAAYEGLYAGMPLFISTTSGVPNNLLDQPFVQGVAFDSSLRTFNRQLSRYMAMVREAQYRGYRRRIIVRYTKMALDSDSVYWGLCRRIGLCGLREEDKN
eukprot:scaffold251616_cov32-Prasinocladus_malaysianus.AAC.1